MADSPDLSRIIGIIMEHPEIVGQISALLSQSDAGVAPNDEVAASAEPSASVEASAPPKHRGDRARLLGALKPYLSKNRAQAVDTMITVTEILDSMKGGS